MAKSSIGGRRSGHSENWYAKYNEANAKLSISDIKEKLSKQYGYEVSDNEAYRWQAEVKEGVALQNDYWLGGLNGERYSNNYLTFDRVSKDNNRIMVKVADSHLIETQYGHGLILDKNHVVWLKPQQVNRNYYGNKVQWEHKLVTAKQAAIIKNIARRSIYG